LYLQLDATYCNPPERHFQCSNFAASLNLEISMLSFICFVAVMWALTPFAVIAMALIRRLSFDVSTQYPRPPISKGGAS